MIRPSKPLERTISALHNIRNISRHRTGPPLFELFRLLYVINSPNVVLESVFANALNKGGIHPMPPRTDRVGFNSIQRIEHAIIIRCNLPRFHFF